MNISLTPELDELVKQKVKTGMYHSASEVIREALRLLHAQEEQRHQKMSVLKQAIEKGIESLNSGDGIVMDGALFEGIKQRGRDRLCEKK